MDYLTAKQAAEKWNISRAEFKFYASRGALRALYAWDGHGRYLRMLRNLTICV